jgi:hypothetical protein
LQERLCKHGYCRYTDNTVAKSHVIGRAIRPPTGESAMGDVTETTT